MSMMCAMRMRFMRGTGIWMLDMSARSGSWLAEDDDMKAGTA